MIPGCLISMESVNDPIDTKLVYSSIEPVQEIFPSIDIISWDALFSNQDVTNCGITSCTIFDVSEESSCGTTPYTGVELSILGTSPITLTA